MNHLGSRMALASRRSTGNNGGKRRVPSWSTRTSSRWVSSCLVIATNTERLPIGLYWNPIAPARNYLLQTMLQRKKILGATGPISLCGSWNRMSESFGSSSISKPLEISRRLVSSERKSLVGCNRAILWCRQKSDRLLGATQPQLSRIDLPITMILRVRAALLARISGARIHATAISLNNASACFESSLSCSALAPKVSTTI